MIVRSMALLATACAALVAAPAARAWDTAPWGAMPFDQPNQISAGARAKIARIEAEGMARAGTAAHGGRAARTVSVPSLVTDGRRGCSVNLGNVVLPLQGVRGGTDLSTNVQVKGDVITVCR